MPNVGPLEIMIVLIVALVVFGPKRLPELGKSVGKGFREFKSSIAGDEDDDHRSDDAHRERLQALSSGDATDDRSAAASGERTGAAA